MVPRDLLTKAALLTATFPAGLGLALGGCGSDDDNGGGGTTSDFTTEKDLTTTADTTRTDRY
jgi:hypothetical protein